MGDAMQSFLYGISAMGICTAVIRVWSAVKSFCGKALKRERPMTINQSFWNRWAGQYDRAMAAGRGLYGQIAGRIREGLNREMNVLELACGTGLLSEKLAGKVRLLEATDFSEAMVRHAKAKSSSSRIHFSVQDATNLPYAAASFDAVVIANALHIMPQPELALAEIYRVLKPGGTLYAPTFVNGKGFGFRLRAGIMALGGFKVFSRWSPEGFAAYITAHGFEVTRTERLGGKAMPLCYLEAVLPHAGGEQSDGGAIAARKEEG